MRKTILTTAMIIMALNTTWAVDIPKRSAYDKRIQTVSYNPDDVVPISAVNGYATEIVFSAGETIRDYGTGYSSAWEFAARGNHFFLKPKAPRGTTNLIVVTDKRTYAFDLHLVSKKEQATYRMTFIYPDDEQATINKEFEKARVENRLGHKTVPSKEEAIPKPSVNTHYSMAAGGDKAGIAPKAAYDDGRFTVLHFHPNVDYPTVYRVVGGEETLVNSHIEDGALVVHGVFDELRLRAGDSVVGVYNDAMNVDAGAGKEKETVTVPGIERRILSQGSDEKLNGSTF